MMLFWIGLGAFLVVDAIFVVGGIVGWVALVSGED